jgi:hypothetical protein
MTINAKAGHAGHPILKCHGPPTLSLVDQDQYGHEMVAYSDQVLQRLMTAVTMLPPVRFAVGSFDSWGQLCPAVAEMGRLGLASDRFNHVAQRQVFADRGAFDRLNMSRTIEDLAFPESQKPVCCTSGKLADCLHERVRAGAKTFQDALGHWLLPRHASHFQAAVDRGRILAWVQLGDANDERNAYQVLLASSSNLVGVHDLMSITRPAGHS